MLRSQRQWHRRLILGIESVLLGLVTSVGVACGLGHVFSNPGPASPLLTSISNSRVQGGVEGNGVPIWIRLETYELPGVSRWEFSAFEVLSRVNPNAPSLPLDTGDFQKQTAPTYCQAALERHLPLLRAHDANYVTFAVRVAGWPWRCLALEDACTAADATNAKSAGFWNYTTRPSRAPVDPAFDLWPLYLHPLWPGLLANTAFYGGAWALLLGGPILIRRWLRARKGGCVHCGYPPP